MRDQRWQDRAACKGDEPDLFHPDGWGRDYLGWIEGAKAVCEDCPVRAECLDDALSRSADADQYDIRAGLTPKERNVIRLLSKGATTP